MKQIILYNGQQQNIPTTPIEAVAVAVELQVKNNQFDNEFDNYTEIFRNIYHVKTGIKNNDLKETFKGLYRLEFKIEKYFDIDYYLRYKILKYAGNGGTMKPIVRDLERILVKELKNSEYAVKKYGLDYI